MLNNSGPRSGIRKVLGSVMHYALLCTKPPCGKRLWSTTKSGNTWKTHKEEYTSSLQRIPDCLLRGSPCYIWNAAHLDLSIQTSLKAIRGGALEEDDHYVR